MTARILHMPPRATGEANQKEREEMTKPPDRYDMMTREELRQECRERGMPYSTIERRQGWAELRQHLRADDAIGDIDVWIVKTKLCLAAVLQTPMEQSLHLARPALARRACELALDLLCDHN